MKSQIDIFEEIIVDNFADGRGYGSGESAGVVRG